MTLFREIELGIPISFQFLFSLLKIIREIHFHKKKKFVTSIFSNRIEFIWSYFIFKGCECSEERISPAEFALCAAESTCRADCQRRGKGKALKK